MDGRIIPFALIGLAIAIDALPARPKPEPVAVPAGKAETCIPINMIRESRVRDDRTIDFFVGRKVYRVTLDPPCPTLGSEKAFSYETSLSQLCSTDIITVYRNGLPGARGPSCGLAPFQPVTGIR